MKTFALTATLGATCLGLAACEVNKYENAADNNLAAAGNDVTTTAAPGTTTTTTTNVFVPGTRIVEEGGVTFRIDPDGTRVRLGPSDPRILVEDGVRYRVDPGGTRVRIDGQGAEIRVPVTGDLAVEVNTSP